ncbi:MAG: hypothetical protein IJL07_01135 [Lachnospiraceae bacterium]|nr:hypothetical protein [Lachnospiraceae bacterium]
MDKDFEKETEEDEQDSVYPTKEECAACNLNRATPCIGFCLRKIMKKDYGKRGGKDAGISS